MHPRLPGIEPKQPNVAKTTASSAGLTTPARCHSCPPTSSPPQHTYQLQECGARRAISPAFISSPALLHQHRAQTGVESFAIEAMALWLTVGMMKR